MQCEWALIRSGRQKTTLEVFQALCQQVQPYFMKLIKLAHIYDKSIRHGIVEFFLPIYEIVLALNDS